MKTALPSRPPPVVLAAPSGTGKTTIARALVDGFEDFVFSVSVTTRAPRAGERDGVDYEFVTAGEFQRMVAAEELVEWAEVHGNLYGTPRRGIEAARETGRHPVLDIDVQGARQVRERLPDAILVFVFPPSGNALGARLAKRGTEDDAEVRRRLRAAHREMEESAGFDYIIVNEELSAAVARVREVVLSEGHRTERVRDLEAEVARVRAEIDRLLAAGTPRNAAAG
ncbi:MAG: guanylate kinase [Gemmatimonadota bacterium]